jgi:chromosome segregation ATPase
VRRLEMADFKNLDEKISSAIEKGRKLKKEETAKTKAVAAETSQETPAKGRNMAAELQDLEAKISSAIEKVKELKEKKEAAEAKASELETALTEKDKSIEELRAQAAQQAEAGAAEKDKVIDELRTKLTSVDQQVESLLKDVLGQ